MTAARSSIQQLLVETFLVVLEFIASQRGEVRMLLSRCSVSREWRTISLPYILHRTGQRGGRRPQLLLYLCRKSQCSRYYQAPRDFLDEDLDRSKVAGLLEHLTELQALYVENAYLGADSLGGDTILPLATTHASPICGNGCRGALLMV